MLANRRVVVRLRGDIQQAFHKASPGRQWVMHRLSAT
jgi:hypothetical protein